MTIQIPLKRNDWVFQYWTMILAICVVVDESICLDIPIWEFSIILEHPPFYVGNKQDTASAACPAHPGSLDMISMTFAAAVDLKSIVLLRVFPLLFFLLVLQGKAGAIGVSNFLLAIFDDFLELHVLRVNEIDSS